MTTSYSRRFVPVLLMAAALGCSQRVKPGSEVLFNYELKTDKGELIETTFGDTPSTIKLGEGDALPGLEEALAGMKAGQEKSGTLPPEKAFGERDPKEVQRVPLSKFGDLARQLKVGGEVEGFKDGKPSAGRILEIGKEDVLLDFNHPLAGKTLSYKLEVLKVSR